ncbi:hypothetical protein REPUB_Repub02eG0078500 [Reevesia pubescens]
MVAVKEKSDVPDGMDFDKLMPYSSLPKVGKIAHYDAESSRIMLTPVPEYPNASEKKIDDEAFELPNTTTYGEDGSLEVCKLKLYTLHLIRDSFVYLCPLLVVLRT